MQPLETLQKQTNNGFWSKLTTKNCPLWQKEVINLYINHVRACVCVCVKKRREQFQHIIFLCLKIEKSGNKTELGFGVLDAWNRIIKLKNINCNIYFSTIFKNDFSFTEQYQHSYIQILVDI